MAGSKRDTALSEVIDSNVLYSGSEVARMLTDGAKAVLSARNAAILARMRMTLPALALSISCWPAFSAQPQITDPVKFVAGVYKHYVDAQTAHKDYDAPDNIYTPRLAKLLQHDKDAAKGEVGCLEFDFWVNGQDWKITTPTVTSGGGGGVDRNVVVAKFTNLGTANELHFDFLRIEGNWLLDDVHSVKEPRWTLSEILKCAP